MGLPQPAALGEIVACANQKGGVGKTTTVVNVAAYLAGSGSRVVVIDLDPQGNASSGLGLGRSSGATLYEAVSGELPIGDVLRPSVVEGVMVAPSSSSLAGLEIELVPAAGRERALARCLAPLPGDFDFILVDCPPSLGLLTVNALTAAHSVLVPIQCEYYALEGLSQLIETVALIRDHLNPPLQVKGIVLTMYDGRTKLSADVVAEVRSHFGDDVFDTVIPRNVRLSEAPSYAQPIALYRPESKGARAYQELTAEFLGRSVARARAFALPPVAEERLAAVAVAVSA